MAETFVVQGGKQLRGSVRLPGAKNSVLPLLAGAVLCRGAVRLHGAPHIGDVQTSRELLTELGIWSGWEDDTLVVRPGELRTGLLPARQAGAMRASVFYLAPLLARVGRVTLPAPGGCRLGPRPIDIHLDGLAHMGARVRWQQDAITLERHGRLRAIDYTLRLPSVGATETLMMAAAQAQGTTVLRGVACEPEVVDLAAFLNRCGAQIRGAGTPTQVIRGVSELNGCDWTPVPDRIVGCTWAAAAACAGGSVRLLRARTAHLEPMLRLLERLGCGVTREGAAVTVERDGPLRGDVTVRTGSYPEFPSDAAPLAAAVMLFAQGEGFAEDALFERRFMCAPGFAAMGADLQGGGRQLRIRGGAPLRGAEVCATDLRGGAALLLAALGAAGESRVAGAQHILRGYEEPDRILTALGADVRYL